MITRLYNRYLIFGLIFYSFFLIGLESPNYFIYLTNFSALILYFIILVYNQSRKVNYYTKKNLTEVVLSYSLFFVFVYNFVSYYYNKNFFVFSEGDAVAYDDLAIRMASFPLMKSIDYALSILSLEDLGAVLLISNVYRLVSSNLMLNIFYLIIGGLTVRSIFTIGQNFMSSRYAFLAALTYGISSYVIWFQASGLKESFMIFLVVLSFEHLIIYRKSGGFYHLLALFISAITLILFRAAILFIFLASILISYMISKQKGLSSILLNIAIILVIIYFNSLFFETKDRLLGDEIGSRIEQKEELGMLRGNVTFDLSVHFLAGLIGPLPTFSPGENKQMLSMFAPGLLLRVFIASLFWLGIYYIFKLRNANMYPLVFFFILEISSLIIILDALELRKSISHFPFIYIISFYFLSLLDNPKMISQRNRKRYIHIIDSFLYIVFIIIFYWNTRYL